MFSILHPHILSILNNEYFKIIHFWELFCKLHDHLYITTTWCAIRNSPQKWSRNLEYHYWRLNLQYIWSTPSYVDLATSDQFMHWVPWHKPWSIIYILYTIMSLSHQGTRGISKPGQFPNCVRRSLSDLGHPIPRPVICHDIPVLLSQGYNENMPLGACLPCQHGIVASSTQIVQSCWLSSPSTQWFLRSALNGGCPQALRQQR